MTLQEYMTRATETASYPDAIKYLYVAAGLAGEAGEVANKAKKIYRDDDGMLTEARRQQMAKELGDVLWYWAMCCKQYGLDPSVVAEANLQKLRTRKAEGKIRGDGDDR
jgi:NTP pyrophosphatase (non-canonical NTP hydrolase)